MPSARNIEMAVGILFQEYHLGTKTKIPRAATVIRFSWVVTAMVMTMALIGNLKSSLVKSRHEKRTMTLDEAIDKDMKVHLVSTSEAYLNSGITQSDLNKRILCQVRKTDSVYPFDK